MIKHFDPTWHALAREASLGTRLIATGLGALRKADPSRSGVYYEGFFGLTIGLERICKLTIAVSDFVANANFPTDEYFKKRYGHKLDRLVAEVQKRVQSGVLSPYYPLHATVETSDLVGFLSGFANTTRYYNLTSLNTSTLQHAEPIEAWHNLVLKHYPERPPTPKESEDAARAAWLDENFGSASQILHSDEAGNLVNSFTGMAETGRRARHIQKMGTMMCIHLARPIESALASLSSGVTQNGDELPVFSEFTTMLNNEDSFLRTRKTFHHP